MPPWNGGSARISGRLQQAEAARGRSLELIHLALVGDDGQQPEGFDSFSPQDPDLFVCRTDQASIPHTTLFLSLANAESRGGVGKKSNVIFQALKSVLKRN